MSISAAELNVRINTQGAAAAKRDLNDMGDAVNRTESNRRMMGAGLLGMGTTIAGVFGYGVTQAISFGEQMANVNSIAQLTTGELEAVSDQVIAIGQNTGQGPQVLAAGLYDIYSSGFAGAEGLQILEVSANAANAGLTTTDVSARAITASLNAYGLEASEAGHVSDVLFQTVNEGVITFEQLANNLGNTLPLANALGVSIEELGGAYSRMTLSGVGASQAETQIAALMRSAINPTDALTAAVQDYGYANVEALLAAEGMVGYLTVLNEASNGSKEALFDLLGTTEAVNSALILGGENTDEYAASVERMKASSEGLGATQTALNKQMESTAFSIKLLKTNIQAAAIAIGVQLEPGIKFVAKSLTKLIKVFLNFSKPVQKVIGIVVGLVGVLSLVAGAVILFGTQIAAAGALLLGMLGPIALVVAAVAGLYFAWKTNFLGLRDVVKDAFRPITKFIDNFKKAWKGLEGTSDVMDKVLGWGGRAGSIVGPVNSVSRALSSMAMAIRGIGGDNTPAWLVGLADGFDRAAEFVQGFKDAWDNLGVSSVTDQINEWGGITSSSMSVGERALWSFSEGLKAISGDDTPAWLVQLAFGFDRLADALQTGGVAGFVSQLGTELENLVDAIPVQGIAIAIGGWVFDAATDIASALWDWVSPQLAGIGEAIMDPISVAVSIGNWIISAVTNLWDAVTSWALGYGADSGMSGDGTGGASPAKTISLGEVAVKIGDWIVSAATSVWDAVRSFVMGGGKSGVNRPGSVAAGASSGDEGITLPGVVVNISGWAKGIIAPLWDAVKRFVMGAGGGGGMESAPGGMRAVDEGITLSGVLVNISGWVQGVIAPLWDTVRGWFTGPGGMEEAPGGMRASGGGGIVIPSVLVDIGGWAKGIIAPLWDTVRGWFTGGGGGQGMEAAMRRSAGMGGGGGIDIPDVLVNIGGWVQGIIPDDLWETVQGWADDAWDLVKDTAYKIDNMVVEIDGFTGEADETAFWAEVERVVNELWTVSDTTMARMAATGQEHGRKLGEWVISTFFGGMADGSTGIESSTTASEGTTGQRNVTNAAAAYLDNLLGGVVSGAWDQLKIELAEEWEQVKTDFAALFDFNIDWPDIEISLPTITWPTTDDLMALVPQDVKDFFNDPLDWVKDQLSGGGTSTGQSSGAAPGAGGGGGGQELESRRGGKSAGGSMSMMITVDYSQAMAGISTVQAAWDTFKSGMSSAVGIIIPTPDTSGFTGAIGLAKTAWDTFKSGLSGGGDGGRGAAGGAAGPAAFTLPAFETSAFTSSLNTAKLAVMTAMTSIRTVIMSGMAGATATVVAGSAAMSGSMVAGMATFRGAVTSGMAAAAAAVRAGVAAMVGAARGAAGAMAGAGRSAIQGLVSGVASGLGALQNVVNRAISIMSQIPKLGNSPWPMMIDAGQDAMDGLVVGMENRQRALANTIGSTIGMFDVAPRLAAPAFAGSVARAPSSGGGGAPSITVHVHVAGDLTSEGNLTRNITTALTDELRRHKIAYGVAA